MWLWFLIQERNEIFEVSFSKIYGDEVADEMIDLVRKTLDRLYDSYSCVDSPNVVVPSGSERTHIEGDTIGCPIHIWGLILDMSISWRLRSL